MDKEIKNLNWEKFWAFKFSLLGASILGDYFVTKMGKQMGKCFQNVVIISKKGHSSCFVVKEQRKEFGKHQIKTYVKDGSIKEFCYAFRKETNKMFSLMKLLKNKEITNQEFKEFIKAVMHYDGVYAIPRQIIDFIDPSMVEKLLNDLKEVRLYAEPVFSLIDETIYKFATQIGDKTNYDPNIITCMIIDELELYLDTGKLPKKEELQKRYERCGLIFDKSSYTNITNKKEINELEKFHIKETKNEVKGNIAFKGKAKGIARIIFNPFKVTKFNKGDILITGMTRPDYLPLMKKAAAIVTDVGGLLCHAAIVSREIGKPCIIGTQIATQTFKDGDLLEVDANKGIIKKL